MSRHILYVWPLLYLNASVVMARGTGKKCDGSNHLSQSVVAMASAMGLTMGELSHTGHL